MVLPASTAVSEAQAMSALVEVGAMFEPLIKLKIPLLYSVIYAVICVFVAVCGVINAGMYHIAVAYPLERSSNAARTDEHQKRIQ